MRAFTSLAVLLSLGGIILAQDVQSGPEVGKKAPGLEVQAVTGPNAGQKLDYAKDRGEKPTVYLFIKADKWDRPMARFVKVLDKDIQKMDGANVVAVWLTGDGDKTQQYLPLAQQSLQLEATALTFFPGGADGPPTWTINGDAHITVVLSKKGQVQERLGYFSINETEVQPVLKKLAK